MSAVMDSRKASARLIGALYLAGFVTYGVGSLLVTHVLHAPALVSTISAHHTTLALGAFLILLNSVTVVGLAVVFFPILQNHARRSALVYLAALISEAVLFAVGTLGVLMVIPLTRHGADAGVASVVGAKALGSLATQWNNLAYQIAEISLGFGGMFLCAVLFRVRLVPRFLAGWGFIGYAILLAGMIAELFSIHIGTALSIPGGAFEVTLACWLIVKGFRPEAYGRVSQSPVVRPAAELDAAA